MLDVAVNLLWCVPGQVGGSEDYLVRQLLGLHEVRDEAPDVQVTAFAVRGFGAAQPEVARAVRVVEAGIDGTSRPRRIVAESTWLHARTARSASSSCAVGTPNTATTASPANFSTVPP